MESEKLQEIQQWLIKSERDLGAAKFLLNSPDSFLDVVVYHCMSSESFSQGAAMLPVIESIVQTMRALSPERQQEVLDFADFLVQKSNSVATCDAPKKRVLGLHEGKGWLSDDFNEPLPDDFWLGDHESVA